MKNSRILRKLAGLLFVPFLITGCEDRMDEHYEVPGWVADSAWGVLQTGSHGSYSTFLKGVEISGFQPLLKGKSVITVMAPDDEAFAKYLNEQGYTSIEDMPVEDVKKLIGYHILYYSYNTENLVNFRPAGELETDEEKEVGAGLYYKHRTYSADEPEKVIDPTTQTEKLVYHLERYLPVFSHRFFKSKNIDAKTNYEYFYPNSTWTGDNGFNVSNASVKEYGVIANNGYIHTIDRVLQPLETIHTELKRMTDYSQYRDLYDVYGSYEYDETLTNEYAKAYGVDTIYQYIHETVPSIACEWQSTSYMDFGVNTATAYTIFAPSNTAINTFFNSFWGKGGYNSLDEVDELAVSSFIKQYIYNVSMIFPDEIENNEDLKNVDGTAINVDPATVKDRVMCVNGAFYGLDNLEMPATFASVMGPVYQYKDARPFLYAVNGSGMLGSYASPEARYVVLVPMEQQFLNSGYQVNYTEHKLLVEGDDGSWVDIGSSTQQDLVYMHLSDLDVTEEGELPATGTKVYPTLKAWNYWFVKDGKITCNSIFNEQLQPEFNGEIWGELKKFTDCTNGTAYKFEHERLFAPDEVELTYQLAVCNDARYAYHRFAQLLKLSGITVGNSLSNITTPFVAFIPTNEAIDEAMKSGRIPGIEGAFNVDGTFDGEVTDKSALMKYLFAYFMTTNYNAIPDYPYLGSTMKSGTYYGEALMTSTPEELPEIPELNYEDNGTSLSIQWKDHTKCNVITDYDYFPFAYKDGCFHLIDNVF